MDFLSLVTTKSSSAEDSRWIRSDEHTQVPVTIEIDQPAVPRIVLEGTPLVPGTAAGKVKFGTAAATKIVGFLYKDTEITAFTGPNLVAASLIQGLVNKFYLPVKIAVGAETPSGVDFVNVRTDGVL